jgi:surface protein
MFSGASQFDGDLSRWDVRNVKDMSWMFHQAALFNGDLSQWSLDNATNLSSMFNGAVRYKGVRWSGSDPSPWDVF